MPGSEVERRLAKPFAKTPANYCDTLASKIPSPTSNKISLTELSLNLLQAKPDGKQGWRYLTSTRNPLQDTFFKTLVLANGSRYRRLAGRDSLPKRTKPKATKKANLAVRIQPSWCTPC